MALGFGAKINPSQALNNCFPLDLDTESWYCKDLDQVLNNYHKIFNKITLSGPTNFAPFLAKCR